MTDLLTKETQIAFKLKSGEPEFIFAFDKLLERFGDDDEKNFSKHCPLIRSIYIEDSSVPMWKLAAHFNISDRTLYRYRKNYLDWIDFFLLKYHKLNSSDIG